MNTHLVSSVGAVGHAIQLLAVPVFETDAGAEPVLPADLVEATTGSYLAEDLNSKLGESVVSYRRGETGPERVLLLGVGKASDLDAETLRRWAGHAVRAAESIGVGAVGVYLGGLGGIDVETASQAVTEGAVLASWRFTEMRRLDEDAPPEVTEFTVMAEAEHVDEAGRGALAGQAIGRAANFTRTLQSRPGNVATPTHLAEEATRMAGERGLGVTVLGPDKLKEERMHALLAVAQGSDEDPRLIILRHDGGEEGAPPLVLVGKGLTFDAGGISIKPSGGMEDMIFDMSGGAAVIGTMQAVAELEVPLNLIGIVPSSENLLNGSAMKPGDIIQSREGKTIEVVNTDAEGRLILADALSYAQSLEPEAIVDCATLTGSVVIALGHHAAAVMGTDNDLVGELQEAGDLSGERCWPMPLWDEYRRQIDSDVADVVNVGGHPGGSITAAAFLKEFVGDCKWAHLDIAGTAYGEGKLPYQRKGAAGFPTRLLVQWVRGRSA